MTNDDLHTTLVDWFESWEMSTVTSRAERELERDFHDGKQWTQQELAELKKRKQPVVTYNRIAPKINSLKGLEESRRREPRAFPRNVPNDDQSAEAATTALRFVLDDQGWGELCTWLFENHAVEGTCGVDVSASRGPDGSMCVYLAQIAWNRLWGDEHSTKPDWSDAKYKGQFIWMDLKDAKRKWPGKEDILDATSTWTVNGDTYEDVPRVRWTSPRRDRVRIVDVWFKEGDTWYYAQYTKGGVLAVAESPYKNEDGVSDCGFEFSSCFIDRDGSRYGMVKNWVSVQQEINKRRSKAMHLLNSNRVQMERGTVEDVNRLKRELADPNGVIETRPGRKIELLDNMELADAHQRLGEEAKQEIDAVGVNAALAGTERRVMSGRALEQRSEQGLNEVGPVFGTFEAFKLRVYRKVWNRIKQFWTGEKWIRITDDPKNVQFVGINVPMTLGEQLLQRFKEQNPDAPPEVLQQAEMQAAQDPRMQVVVGLKNDVGNLDADIRLDQVPASASLQGEQFDRLAEIAPNAGNMPPPLFKALVEASSLHNKDKILAMLDGKQEDGPSVQEQQLQQQVEELTAQVETNDLENQKKAIEQERRLLAAETKAMKAELELQAERLRSQQAELSAQQQALAATAPTGVQ